MKTYLRQKARLFFIFYIIDLRYSRYKHVFRRIYVDFDDNGAIDIFLRTRRRIFAGNSASLIKHMRGHTTLVAPNENLKSGWFVVTGYLKNAQPNAGVNYSAINKF